VNIGVEGQLFILILILVSSVISQVPLKIESESGSGRPGQEKVKSD